MRDGLKTLVACAAFGCAGCAQTMLAPVTPARPPTSAGEPGADRLVADMRRSIDLTGEQAWGEILVSLDRLRNHSHASAGEFASMRRRLAEVLTGAGRSGRVPMRFVSRADEPVDYELSGTAYLMTSQGFDLWELYLSLHASGQSWTVWNADNAVRMLRQPRAGESGTVTYFRRENR